MPQPTSAALLKLTLPLAAESSLESRDKKHRGVGEQLE